MKFYATSTPVQRGYLYIRNGGLRKSIPFNLDLEKYDHGEGLGEPKWTALLRRPEGL